MKRIIISLLIGLIAFQTIYSQDEQHIDWKIDLDFLAKELPEKHYNLFTVKSKQEFLSDINAIKLNSEKMTDFQVTLRTQQLIAKMGDSHTALYFNQLLDKSQILPIHLFLTSAGFHILHTTPENKEILGSKLLSINKIPIQTIVDSLSTILTIDNQAVVKSRIPQFIPSIQILEYFGFTNQKEVELGLETSAGQMQNYTLKPSEMSRNNRVSYKPDAFAFCIKNEKAFFTDLYYPEEKIYYMLYNKCWSKEIELESGNKEKAELMPSFNDFEVKALNVLEQNSVNKIIFDLRFNTGGSSAQGTAFIEKLAKFLEKNPHVKTYVIIGRETFSSAILNAMDFKRLTKAIFVGEETSGKPNHFGEVRSFKLPTSKLSIGYSTKYFKKTDENINTLKPDISIEMSFSDFTKGIDPVYEWIKKQ